VVGEFVYEPYGAVIGQRTDAVGDVHLIGHERLLGAMPGHRLWSLGRGAWVGAGVLRSGERVVTVDGSAAVVERVVARPEPAGVFNVEVSREHNYFVGEAGLWAHNA
jgi:hypothetical protein